MNNRAAFVKNVLTIDVEDWIQSVHDVTAALTDRFIRNTHIILSLLAEHDVHATFFVLGLAAEKAPQLVREIHAAGHEVQSHGFGHRLIHTQTPGEFRTDIVKSKRLLEDIIGAPVSGYRAPAFSITSQTLWALDILSEVGFRYDSSVFPMRMRRYGIAGAPLTPHLLTTPGGHRLTEIPVCCFRFAGLRIPAGGGGYLRAWPYAVTRAAVRGMNRAGHPAVLYIHPYELAPTELDELDVYIPWTTRLHQGLGRRGIATRIVHLMNEFRFGTIQALFSTESDSARPTLPMNIPMRAAQRVASA